VSAFDDLAGLGPLPIWDGIAARVVEGEQLTLAVVELDPGAVAREHSHANEQLGIVLSGALTFRIGDETRELGPGAMYTIPSDLPHEATAGPDGAVVIDVFAPPRADWGALEQGEPRPPRWPQA
jgi:quercetin dioxygenase-like cupin family protein